MSPINLTNLSLDFTTHGKPMSQERDMGHPIQYPMVILGLFEEPTMTRGSSAKADEESCG